MTTSNLGRGLVRRLGLAAAAILVLAASSQQRAEALSLASPGTAPSTKVATDGSMIQVRGGHGGGGGHRGGSGQRGGGIQPEGGGLTRPWEAPPRGRGPPVRCCAPRARP